MCQLSIAEPRFLAPFCPSWRVLVRVSLEDFRRGLVEFTLCREFLEVSESAGQLHLGTQCFFTYNHLAFLAVTWKCSIGPLLTGIPLVLSLCDQGLSLQPCSLALHTFCDS